MHIYICVCVFKTESVLFRTQSRLWHHVFRSRPGDEREAAKVGQLVPPEARCRVLWVRKKEGGALLRPWDQ